MITDHFLVTDQVAIVTGAGRGIGRATALALAQRGHRVVLTARDAQAEQSLRETTVGPSLPVSPSPLAPSASPGGSSPGGSALGGVAK